MQTEKNTKKILLLPGDGIGPEVFGPVRDILEHLVASAHVLLEWEEGLIGGIATDRTGLPLPPDTIEKADRCDAVLLGAVGGPKYDSLPYEKRPERALLGIREHLGAFANLRPARLFPELAGSSTLKPEIISDLDLMVVRELTGGIYFGKPRGIVTEQGVRRGINTETYTEPEIARIMRVAFDLARTRRKKSDVRRQGQCPRILRPLEGGGRFRSQGIPGYRAFPYVCGQCRDATGEKSQAV